MHHGAVQSTGEIAAERFLEESMKRRTHGSKSRQLLSPVRTASSSSKGGSQKVKNAPEKDGVSQRSDKSQPGKEKPVKAGKSAKLPQWETIYGSKLDRPPRRTAAEMKKTKKKPKRAQQLDITERETMLVIQWEADGTMSAATPSPNPDEDDEMTLYRALLDHEVTCAISGSTENVFGVFKLTYFVPNKSLEDHEHEKKALHAEESKTTEASQASPRLSIRAEPNQSVGSSAPTNGSTEAPNEGGGWILTRTDLSQNSVVALASRSGEVWNNCPRVCVETPSVTDERPPVIRVNFYSLTDGYSVEKFLTVPASMNLLGPAPLAVIAYERCVEMGLVGDRPGGLDSPTRASSAAPFSVRRRLARSISSPDRPRSGSMREEPAGSGTTPRAAAKGRRESTRSVRASSASICKVLGASFPELLLSALADSGEFQQMVSAGS